MLHSQAAHFKQGLMHGTQFQILGQFYIIKTNNGNVIRCGQTLFLYCPDGSGRLNIAGYEYS